MKVGPTCRNEERAISLVQQATTIPVPAVRRAIVSDSRYVAIILEYVPGATLKEYWSSMSVWQRVCVVWTIRQYVKQLRTVNIPPGIFPGPIDSEPQTCYGCMFTEYVSLVTDHYRRSVLILDVLMMIGCWSIRIIFRAHCVVHAQISRKSPRTEDAEGGDGV